MIHLVDVSETGRDPVEDFEILMRELALFSESLATRPMILAASKMDAIADPEIIDTLKKIASDRGMRFFAISSVTGKGINELKYAMAATVLEPIPQPA